MASLEAGSPRADSVDGDTIEVKPEISRSRDRSDELSSIRVAAVKDEPTGSGTSSPSLLPSKIKTSRSSSSSSVKSRATSESSMDKKELHKNVDDASIKMESSNLAKSGRSGSKEALKRSAPLFDDLPDATTEAESSFVLLEACTYSNKFLGYTEHAMECDCNEEWGKSLNLISTCPICETALSDRDS